MKFERLPLRRVVLDACDGPFGSSLKSEHYSDSGARVIRLGNVGNAVWNDTDAAFVPLDYWTSLPRHHAFAGDLIVAGMGDESHQLGRACVLPDVGQALVKADCYRLRINSASADARFLAYFLSSSAGAAEALSLAEGSTRSRLTLGKALSIPVPSVSVSTQRAIASYLDAKTARIEIALQSLDRMAALLREHRTVLLGEVMAGLHASSVAAMRATPHRKLSVYAEVDLGKARSPESAEGPWMTPYLRAANVKNGSLNLESVLEMNFSPREQERYALHPGDILVTEGAGSMAAVGANAVYRGELDGTICFQNHLLRVRAKQNCDPGFLAWWMRFAYESGLLATLASGAQILNLGSEEVRTLLVRFPDRQDQQRIANYLEAQISRTERLVRAVEAGRNLLQERRQALVTAAVTGQLEIAGAAA